MQILDVAERLTQAMIAGDAEGVASLYAPTATVWHSTDQVELSVEAVKGLVQSIARVADCSIEVRSRLETKRGFVQTQKNSYAFHRGGEAEFYAALVVTLDDECRITHLEEYLDSAGLTPLLAALG